MNIYTKASRLFSVILIMGIAGIYTQSYAQTVTQPISGVTTTAKVYVYTHNLNQTQKKDIRYIIVKSSNGDIKSCFDACDVCYSEDKGYSQNGNVLRCNNCGNTFKIDGLGSQGSGGCWPGHLVHTTDAENVIFQVSDLITGDKYFKTRAITDVTDQQVKVIPVYFDYSVSADVLTVTLESAADRTLYIYSIDGRMCKSVSSSSNVISVDISELNSGVFLLAVQENGRTAVQTIIINR